MADERTFREIGMESALRTEQLSKYRAERDLEIVRRELASVRLERANLRVYLAEARNRGVSVPEGLYPRHFEKFFEGDQQ